MSGQQQNTGGGAKDAGSGNFALKDVYKLLRKEIETSSLQPIDPATFQRIASSLGNLRGQGYEGIEAKLRDRMTDLLAASARLLMETRQHKIRTGVEPLDYSKLTDEEKYLLHAKRESNHRTNEVIVAIVKGRAKVLESISAKVRSKRIVVRFLKPMEPFVGVDTNRYGPFQQEDVASLPFENARSMVENGIAVEVHVQI